MKLKLSTIGLSLLLSIALSACNNTQSKLAELETTPDENPADLYIKLGVQYIQLGNYDIALKYLKHKKL